MKRVLVLSLFLLTGCSASPHTFEAKLALTPLPTPQAVVSKDKLPVDKDRQAWEQKLKSIRDVASAKKAVQDTHVWIERAQVVSKQVEKIKDSQVRSRLQQQQTQVLDGLKSLERAALIKRAQVEAKDYNDSTGEVAKYIAFSHQFQANAIKIMSSVGQSSCCGTNTK